MLHCGPRSSSRDLDVSLREQKKRQTRASLLAEANALFATRGFDATTIEEICERALISKRTFFRYFPSKEHLVFPNHEERLGRFLAFLANAPAELTSFDALRMATRAFALEYMENREHFVQQQRLINTSPTLVAREHEIDRAWEDVMADWFATRPGHRIDGDATLAAQVLAGAAIGVIRATMRAWAARGGDVDLETLGMEALDKLEAGFGAE